MVYFLFIIGFVALIKGADLLIEGASSIAKRFKVPDIVIGLTIVALGTSAPELVVNIIASWEGSTDLAIANVLGSNIANTLLSLGLASFFGALVVKRNTVIKEIPLALLSALILGVVANDRLIDMAETSQISRIDGLVMMGFFLVFFSYSLTLAKASKEEFDDDTKKLPWAKSIWMILIGIFGLAVGGSWIVDGAIEIAKFFGMSEALIGLTIVAVGTSLPEIVTSVLSAKRGKRDLAIGNAVGSNLFNVFWVLALSATIRPLPFSESLNLDVVVNIVAAFLLFLFLYVANKKHVFKKTYGVIFIFIYAAYIALSIYRG